MFYDNFKMKKMAIYNTVWLLKIVWTYSTQYLYQVERARHLLLLRDKILDDKCTLKEDKHAANLVAKATGIPASPSRKPNTETETKQTPQKEKLQKDDKEEVADRDMHLTAKCLKLLQQRRLPLDPTPPTGQKVVTVFWSQYLPASVICES